MLQARPQPVPRVRVSIWYWLNSAPKDQWPRDFKTMHELGFTDVLLVWGLDAAAFSLRKADSHEAIRAAQSAGLGSYLFIWHARHSSLPHQPSFQQMDPAGQALFAFDAFNPQWRATQWKEYLQILAKEYGPEPGLSGYVFDNSFAIGRIGTIDGPAPGPENNYISYNDAEKRLFGKQLPASPADSAWAEWTTARSQWWAAWAQDTKRYIRALDHNPHHEIVLEDGENVIDSDTLSRAGINIKTIIPSFDAMGAYWAPAYSDPNVDAKLADGVHDYLSRIRSAIGPDKKLILSLRLSEGDKEDTSGHATQPTLNQIQRAVDAALQMGVRQIDLYGFRIGVYHLDNTGWHQYQPGSGPAYPLTGQVEQKFICDRPELWDGLKSYLHSIENPSAGKQP